MYKHFNFQTLDKDNSNFSTHSLSGLKVKINFNVNDALKTETFSDKLSTLFKFSIILWRYEANIQKQLFG